MSDEAGFWHVRSDFTSTKPPEVVRQFWEDDERNRQRSLSSFSPELKLVDEGLALYIGPLQGAFSQKDAWQEKQRLRASIAMLIHALDSFLARRHLVVHGYLSEARVFSRNIHEALSRALAFILDDGLTLRFYQGKEIKPARIHKRLSSALADDQTPGNKVYAEFTGRYLRLSAGAHPTLNSFTMRSAQVRPGDKGLAEAVPEHVLMGGLLQDDLGRLALLGQARDVANALATVGLILHEESGAWSRRVQEYRKKVEQAITADDARLDELYS